MDEIFYLFPGLIAAGALFAAYRVVHRSAQLRRAWNSGLTAEGRCLRTFTTTHGGHDTAVRTTLHHVYEFRTPDGRGVRFEEQGGPATVVEGDVVTVHYAPGPDVVATARRPDPAGAAATALGSLVLLGAVVAFCVVFVVTYTTEFRA
ncbi:DUF3592 domain-containing protein [Streptomyces longwoodensis]|uniref:DUF3592 domain-containing protein n=1 Tax=Streptomyces longwoodensis TaxID=68231 RepID=A0A101QV19_9ACTN|nr:DUF3592 domain-containing protein [Streptomyces longwoodensis]KUN36649.1 hypothetical protein AQJ30_20660 [Streptomyces longwoodensis]